VKKAFFLSIISSLALLAALSGQAQDRNDPRVQAGAGDAGPSEDEATLRQQGVDAMARAKKLNKITACTDPYNYPYSASSGEPPGFDVEIFRAIAKKAGLRAELYWADTGTRGGLGRAMRNSIDKGRCDIFLGLSEGIDEDELKEHKLTLTKPYMGFGYVLVVQGKSADVKTLQDAKERKIKIGVNMSTPMDDYLFTNGYERDLVLQSGRLMEKMAKGEIDVSAVFSTALGEAKKRFPEATWKIPEGFVPGEGLRYNATWAVPKKEDALKAFLEEGFQELLKSGEMKRIVEAYGVPFYPPFVN
jgi:ABC-type amino acid transport substrate-binding protein